jgi:hypothetical protein
MGADKNSSQKRGSNKMNTTSNIRLRLNYQSWSRPHSRWSATGPKNQHTPSKQKLTDTHSGNLHGLLPVLHRSDRWPMPVRPVDRAGQASGCSSRTTSVPKSLSDFSRPWNRNTPKTQPARNKNPTQSLTKHLQNYQELTSNNTIKKLTNQTNHLRQIPQRAQTSQTGQEH